MPKKTIYHIIQWSIAIAACAFLIWKIATYDDYASLGESLRNMSWIQWLAVAVCIALMPVNMAIEAWRWRTLMNGASRLVFSGERLEDQGRMSFREAQRQVYYSKLAGLITPWRLGEYPARGVLMSAQESDIWPKVLSMGAVGSATMTAAIVIAGVVSLAFSPAVLTYLSGSYLYALGAVMIILGALFLLLPRALKKYASVNTDLLIRSTGQSFVRLVCWCVQLALVLYALGAIYNSQFTIYNSQFLAQGHDYYTIYNLFIYYLLVTITPNVPIAEVGVRGAWAIVVFGSMNAAMAGVLLWIINTLLPCLIALFFTKK